MSEQNQFLSPEEKVRVVKDFKRAGLGLPERSTPGPNEERVTFLSLTSGQHQPVSMREAPFLLGGLQGLLLQGGGSIPGQPRYHFSVTDVPGGVLFTVRDQQAPPAEQVPLAVCGVAFSEQGAVGVWNVLSSARQIYYEALIGMLGFDTPDNWLGAPSMPERLPWIGAVMSPAIITHPVATGVPGLAGGWLGQFESDVAVALIELERNGRPPALENPGHCFCSYFSYAPAPFPTYSAGPLITDSLWTMRANNERAFDAPWEQPTRNEALAVLQGPDTRLSVSLVDYERGEYALYRLSGRGQQLAQPQLLERVNARYKRGRGKAELPALYGEFVLFERAE